MSGMPRDDIDTPDSHVRGKGASRRKQWMRFCIGATIAVLVVLVLFIGPFFLNRYNASHTLSVECDVLSASADTGSSITRTGLGGSYAEVEIHTKSCGDLLLRSNVSKANQSKIADKLDEGGRYHFTVAAGSYQIRGLLAIIGRQPSVTEFSPVE